MEAAQRDTFVGDIRDEVRSLSHRLDVTVTEFADALKARWPLEEMLGEDLISAAQRRIENKVGIQTKIEDVTAGLWVKVDSFSLLQGLTYLAARLESEFDVREVLFSQSPVREKISMDRNWKFHFCDASETQNDFNYNLNYNLSKAGSRKSTISPNFNDTPWRSLNLPHDWAVEQGFVNIKNEGLQDHGFKAVGGLFPKTSIGWYRKSFFVRKRFRK